MALRDAVAAQELYGVGPGSGGRASVTGSEASFGQGTNHQVLFTT